MHTEDAKRILRTVDEGQRFTFINGKTAQNLREFVIGILNLKTEEYQHHVYTDHNDFSNWLFDVIDDELLGRDLFHANKRQSVALLKARINYLEEEAGM